MFAMLVYMQETIKLFDDIDSLASRPASQEKTKLIGLLIEYGFIELTQEMWRKYLKPDEVQKMSELPAYLSSSMHVIHISHFSFY